MIKRLIEKLNGNFAKPVLAAGCIPVEQLPTGSMKVKWLCEDEELRDAFKRRSV